jgi:hypothetical protein
MSSPLRMQDFRIVARIVLIIVDEIRSSSIFENPTFADLRQARDSHPRRQAGGAPTAEWQSEEWQEEDHIAVDEEIDETLATGTPHATGGNVEGFYSAQTNVRQRPSEMGIHASEEAPRRRLYETPERCAAVLQMQTKEGGISATQSNNKGMKTSVVHLHFGSTRGCSRCSDN